MATDVRRTVERAIARAVAKYTLWSPGARLVVAVSGGADSLCLLGALLTLRARGQRLAPSELIVAHFDHGLRGDESSADARYVQQLADGLGIPCVIGQPDTSYSTRLRLSVEDWARRERYAFLRRVAAEQRAGRIVTGHTRDDQAETILLHWLRGSGLAGLRGMAPLRGDIARPLLDVTHAQTVAFCVAQGWQPREDSSNSDPRFLRNRIRHELLPLLETYNPGIRDLLARNGELLAQDEAYMEAQAQVAWAAVAETPYRGGVRLHRKLTPELPPALRHRLYRAAVHKVSNGEVTLEARHITGLDKQLLDGHTGSFRRLPGGISAMVNYDALVFQQDVVSATRAKIVPHTWNLTVPGVVEMPELGWRIRAWRIAGAPGSEDAGELPPAPELPSFSHADRPAEIGRAESRVYLDAAALGDRLTIRAWQPGDRFRPLGMQGEKKVQDYFSDAKVPRALRSAIPLVFTDDHLIWLAGLRLDDRARLTPATQAVVALQLEPLTPFTGSSPGESMP